ncbi:MAG TPA: DUF6428 family protein [Candidatus Didemnitutus sp.]|nr:DUF6428 family protein [Candidatus Didemnitutus sp.]
MPARYHVTEVGHVRRRFMDCGGTVRSVEACLLQAWTPARNELHRLTGRKLSKILDLSSQVIRSEKLAVELEYDRGGVVQYRVESAATSGQVLVFALGNKKTDCLARETCGLATAVSGCCGKSDCGCS